MFKLNGTLKFKGETVQVSDKFLKREFVVTDTSSMYPQDIAFQLSQDRCDIIDPINEGDSIEVSFNLRGREWTSPSGEVKYFNTLDAWAIVSTEKKSSAIKYPNANFDKPIVEAQPVESDDLPF